jgi:hypothetical protein
MKIWSGSTIFSSTDLTLFRDTELLTIARMKRDDCHDSLGQG